MAADTIFTVLAYALVLAILAVVGLLLTFAVTVYRCDKRYGHLPSPKQQSWIFGHLANINNMREKTDIPPVTLLYQWYRKHGPVFYIRVFFQPVVNCLNTEIVKQLLLDSSHVKPKYLYGFLHSVFGQRFMGYGLVTESNHQKWRMKRAVMNPAFKKSYLLGMMDEFNDTAEALCHHLSKKADGETELLMLSEFSNITLDIISKIGFNINVDAINNSHCPFTSAVNLSLQGTSKAFTHPWVMFDPRSKARQYRNDVQNACKLVRRMGRDCIGKRIAAKKRGDELPKDILTAILQAADDLKDDLAYGMEEMLDEFATFFMAGQETTSSLLASTIIQLGRYPDVATKLRTEVDEVLGHRSYIEHADLGRLEYMSRVFKETMRLYPPVSGTTRETAREIECDGYKIPAGTSVSVSTYLMGRMEEYFDDPLLFNPDRFISNGELPRHAYAYFPFSLGQRNCIGQHLALIEAKIILGKLLQRFDFRLEQSQKFILREEVTNKPFDGCKTYITLRD